MQILLPTLALAATLVLQAHGQYHHDINWVKHHLATKSPYPVPKKTASIKGYNLEQLQLVVRHGTRYPSGGDTKAIAGVIEKLSKGNNSTALAWLDDYENIYTTERSGSLSDDGQLEQYLHGRRVAKSFPNLINSILDGDVASGIDSACSESARTSQSATAFHMGLFEGQGALGKGNQFAIPLFMYADQGDNLIAIDDNCPTWGNATENSDYESDLYKEKTHKTIAARLTQELGVELTADDVESIYTGCCFDVSNQQRADTFCSLLSKQDILESEYREDLSYFYEYSYGMPLNGQVACSLMQNIVQHMDDQDVSITLKFGHTQTILFLQTFLGVNQERKHPMLYANSSQSVIDKRTFRTSNIASMASNVEFQLLSNKKGEKFVRVLVSEVPVVVPGCKGKEICSLKTFKKALASKLECNFDAICQ